MTTHTPLTRYSATNGALASGFIIAELHQLMGYDLTERTSQPPKSRQHRAAWPATLAGWLRFIGIGSVYSVGGKTPPKRGSNLWNSN